MSLTDLVWLLPPLAGVALGVKLRWTAVVLLLGFVLVVTSFVLFGFSMDNYSNNDCQPGAPCTTGEQVIRVVEPVAFLLGSTLVLLGFGRTVWDHWSHRRASRRRVVRR